MQQPQRPYPGYIERVVDRIRRADPPPMSSPFDGASTLHDRLADVVEGDGDALLQLSHDVHDHPELGFEEHQAVQAVANLLVDRGIEAEVGAYGLDTALRATTGTGEPAVAVIAEYDALPEIGHACGHNVICATAVGAFLALHELRDDLDGSVELIATPAEEGGGGKELIARAGGFDHIAAALMVHPFGMDVADHPWLGVRQVAVTYRGLPAHASMMPFLGRNALDAVVLAYTGVGQLRQHMLPSDRVHGIITDGGQAPNIVPERAAALFYLRSAEPETLTVLTEQVQAILESAAAATGTDADITWDPCPAYLPVRNNRPLAARYAVNVSDRARQVLPRGVAPETFAASTDMGNVSVRLPAIHPLLAIAPPEVTIHSPEFAEWAVSERADAATIDGAIGLARTAADYLADAELRSAVSDDFAAEGGVLDVLGLLS
ncbi:MAG: M20 family metallopeptidase [Actinobacteria bacterium]|nr:M20 family metallopeptidase [Actinomycetota bacterium]